MSELTITILAAVGLAALLLWLLRPHRHRAEAPSSQMDLKLGSVLPKHYLFLPQVRQALSAADEKYLREVAPPDVADRALRERRKVARCFLAGLREDFSNLERLRRMVAALSPVISREMETERVLLSLRFHLLYGLVWLRMSTGNIPMQNIERLTGLVGRLATLMQQAMTAVSALSTERLSSEIQA